MARRLDMSGAPSVGASSRGRIIPEILVPVIVYHLCALLVLAPYFFSWAGVVLAAVTTYVFGSVIVIGYHRFFAHKSFRCSKTVERTIAVLGLLCVQRGPAWWAATHRRHHHHADSGLDPHNPRPSALWAHMGWFLFLNENTDPAVILNRYARDLMKDPFYAWIEAGPAWFLFVIASALAIFGAGFSIELVRGGSAAEAVRLGSSLVVWGVFLRTVLVWHLTWSTASCTHRWGYRNYETDDRSRNNAILGYLVMGEGWANNHHAYPRSPRLTARWWEVDTSWLVIKCLAWAGLVTVDPATFPKRPR